jgi:hypothetical protein
VRTTMRLVVAVLAAAVLATSALTASATAATTHQVWGFEIGATSSVGTFWGFLVNEPGTWQASIEHGPLNKTAGGSTSITGGSFSVFPLLTPAANGTITGGQLIASAPVGDGFCTQQFTATGTLTSANGAGSFQATLTHYGFVSQGVCNALFATIDSGSVTLQ